MAYDVLKSCDFRSGIYRYRKDPDKLYRAQLAVNTDFHEFDGRLRAYVSYWQHGDRPEMKETDAPPYVKEVSQFKMYFEYVGPLP